MNGTVAFHSEQVHIKNVNGHTVEKRNIVNIQNGKGTKTVVLSENGKTRKSTHKLSATERKKIENGIFVHRLFKPCHDCLKHGTRSRTKSKSRSRTQKKKGSSK
jgi:hypothetical protein